MPRQNPLAAVNTHGWMMSYADMATILLALFIVLTTLGKDQTGASFMKGMESYRRARNSCGLPGTDRAIALPVAGGKHALVEDEPGGKPVGRSIDGELERLQHYLAELDRVLRIDQLPALAGEATVDCFDRLPAHGLPERVRETASQLAPLLQRGDYRVDVIVWARSPSDASWRKAAEQAAALVDEMAAALGLDEAARARLAPQGQPWRYPRHARPVLSLRVVKLARAS